MIIKLISKIFLINCRLIYVKLVIFSYLISNFNIRNILKLIIYFSTIINNWFFLFILFIKLFKFFFSFCEFLSKRSLN